MSNSTSTSPDPFFLYGTAWKEDDTADLTRMALEHGFRGVDTANQRKHYYEAGVGEAVAGAIQDELVTRSELFLQSKFTYQSGQDDRLPYDPDSDLETQVEQSFTSSLEHLQTDYLDSYVLHGPSARQGLDESDHTVWRSMETLQQDERAKQLGISNVSADQLQALLDFADYAPDFVQNRCFARTGWDHDVRQICDANDITYQGFSLLTANVHELRSPDVVSIAKHHEKTIPQIAFRFAIQLGMLPLTGTTTAEHMDQDLAVFDFQLDDSEVHTLQLLAAS